MENRWLGRNSWLGFLALLGALVFLPALRSPLMMDDYVQVAMLEGHYPSQRSPLDLYDFVTDADRALLVDRGILPFWTDPHLTIKFFRPLSSALRWADHAAFGDAPLPAHLHSFGWWFAAVLAFWHLARRLFGPRSARIATVVFALAPCHATPLAWLSNREVLVSLAFGLFALGEYVRFRDGARARGVSAALAFGLALLGGEYAVGLMGYFVALELAARDRVATRALRLSPIVALVAGYLVVRHALGCATVGSGYYRDPFQEPLRYLATAPYRFGALVTDGWITSESPTWGMPHAVILLVALAGAALVGRALRGAARGLEDGERRSLVAIVVGSLVAVVPLLAVGPSTRTLGIATVGIAAAIGVLVDRAWFRTAPADDGRDGAFLRGAAAILVFARFVHGPTLIVDSSISARDSALTFGRAALALGERVDQTASRRVTVVRGEWQTLLWAPFALNERHEPPARWRVLSLAKHALVLRKDDSTIEIVAPTADGVFPASEDDLFRSDANPVVDGDVLHVRSPPDELTATLFTLPKSVGLRLTFPQPLPDDDLWVAQRRTEFVDAAPPAVGHGFPLDR